MDATGRVNDLIEITERLANLLTKENKALNEKDANEATQYLDEKANLSRIYETRIQGLIDDPPHWLSLWMRQYLNFLYNYSHHKLHPLWYCYHLH